MKETLSFVGKTCSLFSLAISFALFCVPDAGSTSDWRALAPGMELSLVSVHHANSADNPRITILRIDPHLWELRAIDASSTGESANRTARAWCESEGLTAAINAGMFKADGKTHVGLMRFREHVNNGVANNYQSVAAFDPHDPNLAPFHIFDLDSPQMTVQSILKDYDSALQNLRLIKRPGSNQWSKQDKMWSEAALAEDDAGRVLFVFSRTPFSMHDLNAQMLAAGIGIVAAQHLEGGPEAQLYVHVGSFKLEQFGSYETAFRENDSNPAPWPIPNVLGVRRKQQPSK